MRDDLAKAVRPFLTEKRYGHTLRCRDMALRLADRWGCDREKAEEASLLHDITKKADNAGQLQLCDKYGIINRYSESEFPWLIHADTAAEVARDLFGAPRDVCMAIKYHTLGREDMSLLEKIIYLSDAIEEGRDYPGVGEIRKTAFENLDMAVLMSLEGTIKDVEEQGRAPHEQSRMAADFLRKQLEKENRMDNINMEPKELLAEIVKIADGRKAKDMVAVEVTEQTTLADYFLIMTGTSSTHIRALSDEIEFQLKDRFGVYAHHIEGINSNWILMDYSTVVVNIFMSDAREMYALERMWGDSRPVDLSKFITAE